MTHDKQCPLYQFNYEIGSGQDIPECNCKHDYKAALGALICTKQSHPTFNKVSCVFTQEEYETIRHALQLAQEAEQLRKERDELCGLVAHLVNSPNGCWNEKQWELAKKASENGNA